MIHPEKYEVKAAPQDRVRAIISAVTPAGKALETNHHRPRYAEGVNKPHLERSPQGCIETRGVNEAERWQVERSGIPYLAQSGRSDPDFQCAAPPMAACAAFFEESRM
jgi:hypothetical protein